MQKFNNGDSKPNEKPILLMKDEYSPRDFKYEKIKEIYSRELQGPTLKHIDSN
jgi:hypothetical protein